MRKLTLVAVLLSSMAFAQTGKKQVESKPLPKTQTLIFGDGSEITADVERPYDEQITTRPHAKFGSMIRVRTDFNDKLMQSVHEL
jgi:hypothetical protein